MVSMVEAMTARVRRMWSMLGRAIHGRPSIVLARYSDPPLLVWLPRALAALPCSKKSCEAEVFIPQRLMAGWPIQ